MSKKTSMVVSDQKKIIGLCCILILTLAPSQCNKKTSPPSQPDLPPSMLSSANEMLEQHDETEGFVKRFKGGSFSPQQIEFVQGKYETTRSKINPELDRIRQDIDKTTSDQEETDFREQAKAAVDENVVLSSLLETAVTGASPNNLNNFVIRHVNSLPGSWVSVWKMSQGLNPTQKQQFLQFLNKRLKWKTWEEIKP